MKNFNDICLTLWACQTLENVLDYFNVLRKKEQGKKEGMKRQSKLTLKMGILPHQILSPESWGILYRMYRRERENIGGKKKK